MRSDDAYHLFWQDVVKQAEKIEIQNPKLPRKRKMPSNYEIGCATITASIITPEEYYRIVYFVALVL